MTMWKGAALVAALVGAAAAGAAMSPAFGQASTRVAPRAVQIIGGQGSQIGVSIREVDAATTAGQAGGVTIEDVSDDSPAARAGLRKGDVVVEYDGERVRSVRQFTRLVQESVPGRKVQVSLLRDGQKTSVTLEPAERDDFHFFSDSEGARLLEDFGRLRVTPAPTPRAIPPTPALPNLESFVWRSGNQLGITAGDLSPQLADYFGTKDGVLVTSVRQDSAAAKAGLKAGDVVTSVNGSAVESPSALRRAIQRLDDGAEFTLSVIRDKKPMTFTGKVEDQRPRRTFRAVI